MRLALGLGGSLLVACSSVPDEGNLVATDATDATEATESTSAAPRFHDYGGPVIPNVEVVDVFWNSSLDHQGELASFFSGVLDSPYVDWLREYDTPAQSIGRGTFVTSFVDDVATTDHTVIHDADIERELSRLLDANLIPANDGVNRLYMVYLPSNTTTKMGDAISCVDFCAYHYAYRHAGKNVYYGVIPGVENAQCAGGCTLPDDPMGTLTVLSSHELIEAITDPANGLVAPGATLVAPMGWGDTTTGGEIADACQGKFGHVAGYLVESGWSNAANGCVSSR
jgi:hypothetical protein